MLLLSAVEDFVLRTLSAIPTRLARLDYIAGLRSGGHYRHWGLARVYGELAADEAIAQAHTDVWLQVLRTPLPLLYREEQDHELLADRWGKQDRAIEVVPRNTAGGPGRHFQSVLRALSALSAAEAAKKPERPAA